MDGKRIRCGDGVKMAMAHQCHHGCEERPRWKYASYAPLIYSGRSDLEIFPADHCDARPHECDRHHLRAGVQIARIRTLAGPPGLDHAAMQNGGSRAHANSDGVTTRSRPLMGFEG